MYPYIESLNKRFIIQAGQNCFIKENDFGTEPTRWHWARNSLFGSTTLNEPPSSEVEQQQDQADNARGRRMNQEVDFEPELSLEP